METNKRQIGHRVSINLIRSGQIQNAVMSGHLILSEHVAGP